MHHIMLFALRSFVMEDVTPFHNVATIPFKSIGRTRTALASPTFEQFVSDDCVEICVNLGTWRSIESCSAFSEVSKMCVDIRRRTGRIVQL